MTLKVPCERTWPIYRGMGSEVRFCTEGNLCPHCNAIRILRATCLGVADRLEAEVNSDRGLDVLAISVSHAIGRLRADVARVEGRTE